jgi:hypothetical protein
MYHLYARSVIFSVSLKQFVSEFRCFLAINGKKFRKQEPTDLRNGYVVYFLGVVKRMLRRHVDCTSASNCKVEAMSADLLRLRILINCNRLLTTSF